MKKQQLSPSDEAGAASTVDLTEPPAFWYRIAKCFCGRGDSEHEQILIRIVIGAVALVFVLVAMSGAEETWLGLAIVSGHFLVALALLVALLRSPSTSVARRYVGMVSDNVALTFIMIWGGGATALFYPMYLWVSFGMGFRFGRSYLLASALLSAVGFTAVILTTPSWREHLPLTLSLLSALLILPAYASTLLDKLTLALNRAEEANRAKGRFLATMSHELRTPLHAIIGMSDLLKTRHLDAEQRQMVGTVNSAGHVLLEMIEDILDLARIETGSLTKESRDLDLHSVLNTIRSLLFHQARAKAIGLHVELDPDMPYRLHGASRWLEQILINLVGNAIKFTDQGHVIIRARLKEQEGEVIFCHIDVEDTGVGIPPEAIHRIFDRFTQADESTTRHYGGTGLGLAIARQFAERMDGQITVTSEIGHGSCFTLSIPLTLSEGSEERRLAGNVLIIGERDQGLIDLLESWGGDLLHAEDWSSAQRALTGDIMLRAVLLLDPVFDGSHQSFKAALSTRAGFFPTDVIIVGDCDKPEDWPVLARLPRKTDQETLYRALHAALTVPTVIGEEEERQNVQGFVSRNILVAEDNSINRQVIEKMLHIAGHAVTTVNDGEALLDKLEEDTDRFDIIVVDQNMPKINGHDALFIHRIAVGSEHAPFVAITADATDESRQQCMEAGFAGYLTKPVELRELLELIDRLTTDKAVSTDRQMSDSNIVRHPCLMGRQQVIDLNRIERLRELDPGDGFFQTVVKEFIDDAALLIDELEAAAIAGDSTAFRDRAHALRSSATSLGATAICDLCFSWRGMGPSDLAVRGRQEIKALYAEFARLRRALLALVDQAGVTNRH